MVIWKTPPPQTREAEIAANKVKVIYAIGQKLSWDTVGYCLILRAPSTNLFFGTLLGTLAFNFIESVVCSYYLARKLQKVDIEAPLPQLPHLQKPQAASTEKENADSENGKEPEKTATAELNQSEEELSGSTDDPFASNSKEPNFFQMEQKAALHAKESSATSGLKRNSVADSVKVTLNPKIISQAEINSLNNGNQTVEDWKENSATHSKEKSVSTPSQDVSEAITLSHEKVVGQINRSPVNITAELASRNEIVVKSGSLIGSKKTIQFGLESSTVYVSKNTLNLAEFRSDGVSLQTGNVDASSLKGRSSTVVGRKRTLLKLDKPILELEPHEQATSAMATFTEKNDVDRIATLKFNAEGVLERKKTLDPLNKSSKSKFTLVTEAGTSTSRLTSVIHSTKSLGPDKTFNTVDAEPDASTNLSSTIIEEAQNSKEVIPKEPPIPFVPISARTKHGYVRIGLVSAELAAVVFSVVVILIFVSTGDSPRWSHTFYTVDVTDLLVTRLLSALILTAACCFASLAVEARIVGFDLDECLKEAFDCKLAWQSYWYFVCLLGAVPGPLIVGNTGLLFGGSEAYLDGRM
ncbi:hypothetical protein HDU97_006277 [Phlyctochytrium planicorne]|nr:hypothetical protein HDU97_006277 [Phlyctochytrium planicorne]